MKFSVKYDVNILCRKILQEQLDLLKIPYDTIGLGEIVIKGRISDEQQKQMEEALAAYGIELLTDQKSALIQQIKNTIIEMVSEKKLPDIKTSAYLADKLNHSYNYLSNLFSESSYTSIENFIIIQKIERAKQLILSGELTLTEISYQLNYSSVAHLSNQFKKTTGLTPSAFERIIKKRRVNEYAD